MEVMFNTQITYMPLSNLVFAILSFVTAHFYAKT